MFGKVKGQKWRQDPPEKMLKWWKEKKCEEGVENNCKVESRRTKQEVLSFSEKGFTIRFYG